MHNAVADAPLELKIPRQFGYANLDEYIVMPNHIHGIIQIDKNNYDDHANPTIYNQLENDMGVGDGAGHGICSDGATGHGAGDGICTDGATGHGRDAINRVSTDQRTTDPTNSTERNTDGPNFNDARTDIPIPKNPGGITGKSNPMLHDNLSRIIRWYKGRVSFEVRKITDGFSWQSRFHDRIIRNE